MKITVLVENQRCGCAEGAHGLSLFIETEKHKILFDAGPRGDLLLSNAEKLGVDLREADIAILSHGHYDHAGGLAAFLEINSRAVLYIHRRALLGHLADENVGLRRIGVDPVIMERYADRVVLTDDRLEIDDELTLFSDIKTMDFLSTSNLTLFEGTEQQYVPDGFMHEQDLLIRRGDKLTLFAGCSHRGIVNILRRAAELGGKAPDEVFAGFHLTSPGKKTDEPEDFVRSVGAELKAFPCLYYTGHCTGTGPFGILKQQLGERIDYLGCGKCFEVG